MILFSVFWDLEIDYDRVDKMVDGMYRRNMTRMMAWQKERVNRLS